MLYTLVNLKEKTADHSFVANVKNTTTMMVESVNEKNYAEMQNRLKEKYQIELPAKNRMIPGFIDHGYRDYKEPAYRGGLAAAISRAQSKIAQDKAAREAEMERE